MFQDNTIVEIKNDKEYLEMRIEGAKTTGFFCEAHLFSCLCCPAGLPPASHSLRFFRTPTIIEISSRTRTMLGEPRQAITDNAKSAQINKYYAQIRWIILLKWLFFGMISSGIIISITMIVVLSLVRDPSLLNPISKSISLSRFDLIILGLSTPAILGITYHTLLLIKNYCCYFFKIYKLKKMYEPYKNGHAENLFFNSAANQIAEQTHLDKNVVNIIFDYSYGKHNA